MNRLVSRKKNESQTVLSVDSSFHTFCKQTSLTLAVPSFFNVRIARFSLSYIIVNEFFWVHDCWLDKRSNLKTSFLKI